MKKVIETTKITRDIHSKLYSDLHYNPLDDLSFFYKEIETLRKKQIDYAFFLGDIIDSRYTLDELKELLEVFEEISKLTKVLMVLGNHDFYTRLEDGFWIEHDDFAFFEELKNRGIIILNNESYLDENVEVYGLGFDANYYETDEPTLVFDESVKKINFNGDKFNILMTHSPYRVFDVRMIEKHTNLNGIDLTLAGHYHNGCIPWYIPFLQNRGLISPTLSLLPDNARGGKWITNTNYGIISSPARTFSNRSKLRVINNVFYPPVSQEIILKKK